MDSFGDFRLGDIPGKSGKANECEKDGSDDASNFVNIEINPFDVGMLPLDFEASGEFAPAGPQHNPSHTQDQGQ
jgi:hypothetical protein